MAAANPLQSLQEEATCPICLEYFREPVTLPCGHNFCQACISQCWEGSDTDISCPQCRETVKSGNLRPNRQLANVLEIAKRLSVQPAGGERMCGEHQEALKLFCEEDQTPICVVCHLSRAHKAHTVVPIQEAAQEYKEKIQAHLKTLREEREKLFGLKVTGRQKIVSEFQQLQQFLEEQERLLLAQLEKLDKQIVKIQDENITRLSAEISRLNELISEMEGKCQKPANEFLCEKGKLQQPWEISPEVEIRISDFSKKTVALVETLTTFKELSSAPNALTLSPPVTVTLDPDTAHPHLVLSEDGKSVRWANRRQNRTNNPERFDSAHCVLGCEGFTSGRHCWEVDVGCGRRWAVGVARESVRRKGEMSFRPEEGIWAVEWMGAKQFQALTSPVTPLPLCQVPSRIRVCLDCNWGQVTFFGADDEAPIFTFPPGSVPRERIRPWLWVWWWGSQLRLCP
uniref:Zinc finger protein RFP-like n=1 Tax=Pelusios castaneus TaxID=367368 RepID=A0A8C8SPV1_9SAUR